MPAYLEGFTPEGTAQINALHTLRLGVIGSVGEAAALGAYLDEDIRITGVKEVEDFVGNRTQKLRDFDVLALQPLAPGWHEDVPAVCGPHPIDPSIHAKAVGGIEAEIAEWLGQRDVLTESIPGLPGAAYQLVERQLASGHKLFTPTLGVLRAMRLAFQIQFAQEGYTQLPRAEATALFYGRMQKASLPPEELLDEDEMKAVAWKLVG